MDPNSATAQRKSYAGHKVAERATQERQRRKQECNGAATIKSLGRPLNGPAFNGDLYVAPDELYTIVSAKETKDGESGLFISFRKSDQAWTVPVSLGSKMNNGLAHRWGQYVTPDGKYLFYSWGTGEKNCAIPSSRLPLLHRGSPNFRKWMTHYCTVAQSLNGPGDNEDRERSASLRAQGGFWPGKDPTQAKRRFERGDLRPTNPTLSIFH